MALNNDLLKALTANSRSSVTELAKKLGLSRITVKQHMEQLERQVIDGYTVRLKTEIEAKQIKVLVLIAVDQKMIQRLTEQLRKIASVIELASISGEYDYAATLSADNTTTIDNDIDTISQIEGIQRTMTSVILSTKFRR
jgi:DNA-binding Lrp family transcriptional regulator